MHFYDRFYAHDAQLSPVLSQLRMQHTLHGSESGWLEESLHCLMQKLLHVHRLVVDEVAALPAIRAATREELYRRLYRVRDFMAAHYDQPLTLVEMAQVACLSPNHLLRVFKQLFHQSPHQYLRGLRLERAKKLLMNSDYSVTEICHAVGFESVSSFSWRFRREVGMAPEHYRAANR
jgi:AraC-like DNA-binding protein